MKRTGISLFLFFLISSAIFCQDINSESEVLEPEVSLAEVPAKKKNWLVRTYKTICALPINVDLGCEPQLNGNRIFGAVEYNWSKKYFSFLGASYATNLESHSSDFSNSEQKNTQVEIDFKPYALRFVGQENPDKFISFEPGVLFIKEIDDLVTNSVTTYTDEDTLLSANVLLKTEYIVDSYNVIPYFATKMKLPVVGKISLNYEMLFSPAYYNFTSNSLEYRITNLSEIPLNKPEGDLSSVIYNGISTPYITSNLYLNVFNILALTTGAIYKRTTYRSEETDFQSTINLVKWRSGISLLNLGKAELRFKSGIYYEYTWNLYEDTPELNTQSGSWIIGVNAYTAD